MRYRALACLLAVVALLGTADAPPGSAQTPLSGAFALQSGVAKTHGFLAATPAGGGGLRLDLDIWMTGGASGAPLTAYDVAMTKRLHTIIVSDDFTTFLHVHPTLGADGHFRIRQRFPKAGLYHVYADGEPHGFGQQVFRFDLEVGAAAGAASAERALAPSGAVAAAGPYAVRLDRTTLAANGTTLLAVHVREGGRPARDLHPYLGALAHAVFLNARDLTYVHVHPMRFDAANGMGAMPGMKMDAMPGMKMDAMPGMDEAAPLAPGAISSPDMLLHVAVREPGKYKLWLQFRGGEALRVAPFVLTAR
jgi:hypothetical protein